MKDEIRALADRYATELKRSVEKRVAEMDLDDRSHVLIERPSRGKDGATWPVKSVMAIVWK
jgi:hypothetical protein